MSVLKKIMTAIRGGSREFGELILDANGLRIFEQEIRDAQSHVQRAKQELTEVMAKQMQAARRIEGLKREIGDHEGYAVAALERHDETLALEIAERIAECERDLADQQEVHAHYSDHVTRLRELVKKTERQIKEYERQLSMVRTTESVQKASAAINDNFSATNSSILSAKDSLERIRQRQQETYDRLAAAEQIETESAEKSLPEKLKASGLVPKDNDATAVLERLKARQR